jgi:hypothetical protein
LTSIVFQINGNVSHALLGHSVNNHLFGSNRKPFSPRAQRVAVDNVNHGLFVLHPDQVLSGAFAIQQGLTLLKEDLIKIGKIPHAIGRCHALGKGWTRKRDTRQNQRTYEFSKSSEEK